MRHRTTILALVLLVMVSLLILPLASVSPIYATAAGPACLLLTLLLILAFVILLVLPRLIARR